MDAREARLGNKNRKNDLLRRAAEITAVEVLRYVFPTSVLSVSDILGEIRKDGQLITTQNNLKP